MLDTIKGFEAMRDFKGCCGCIDGTFIFIKIRALSTQDNNLLVNNTYTKCYTMKVLAVCASKMLFMNVCTGNLSHVACRALHAGYCHEHCLIVSYSYRYTWLACSFLDSTTDADVYVA